MQPADAGDAETIISVRAAAFGDGEEEVRRHVIQGLRQPNQRYFLAMLAGEPIGTLRVSAHDPHIYITAFGYYHLDI
jgi:hypothetical protein